MGLRFQSGAKMRKLVHKTAHMLAKAGYTMWKNRVEKSLEWEAKVGIKERKGDMNKTGWRVWRNGAEGKRRRGRPRIEGDVRPETVLRRARVDRYNDTLAEGMTVPEAQAAVAAWVEEEARRRKKARAEGAMPKSKDIRSMGVAGEKTTPTFKPTTRDEETRRRQMAADLKLLANEEE